MTLEMTLASKHIADFLHEIRGSPFGRLALTRTSVQFVDRALLTISPVWRGTTQMVAPDNGLSLTDT